MQMPEEHLLTLSCCCLLLLTPNIANQSYLVRQTAKAEVNCNKKIPTLGTAKTRVGVGEGGFNHGIGSDALIPTHEVV
jgi:hypothetical protein